MTPQLLHWRRDQAQIAVMWQHVVGLVCDGIIEYPCNHEDGGAVGLNFKMWPLSAKPKPKPKPKREKRKEHRVTHA